MRNRNGIHWLWLGLLVCLLDATPAHAFYNPQQGRWLNRDPLGESGFELVGQRPETNEEISRERKRAALKTLGATNPKLGAFLNSAIFQAALEQESSLGKARESNLYVFINNDAASSVDPLGLTRHNVKYYWACPASIRGGICKSFTCSVTVSVDSFWPRHPLDLAVCLGWNNLSMSMGCLMDSYGGFSKACDQAAGCFALFW